MRPVLLALLASAAFLRDRPGTGIPFLVIGLILAAWHRPAGILLLAVGLVVLAGATETRPRLEAPGVVAFEARVRGPSRIRGTRTVVPVSGGLEIVLPGAFPGPLPGSRISGMGRRPPGSTRIFVADLSALRVDEPHPLDPAALIARLRRICRERLCDGLSQRHADLMSALVLGDRTIPEDLARGLARSGTLHLFAVSGMHLVLVSGMLRRLVGERPRILLAGSMAYAVLTGLGTPVARALLMSSLPIIARLLARRPQPLPEFLLTAAALAWLDEGAWSDVGTWLSFSAAFGIAFLARPAILSRRPLADLDPAERPPRRWLRESLLVSAAAFAASAPVSARSFHRLSPIAIPASVVLGPLVDALLGLGLAKMILGPRLPLDPLIGLLAGILELVGRLGGGLPGAGLEVPGPDPGRLLLHAGALLLCARAASRGLGLRGPALLLAAATLVLALPRGGERGLHLLEAGPGAALLLRFPGSSVLLDAGPRSAHVADQLLARGVQELDHVLLTHGHADHAGGLDEILLRLRVREAPVGLEGGRTPARGHPLGPALEVLWPLEPPRARPENDLSSVLRVRLHGLTVLLTGDIEARGTLGLLAAAGPIPAGILVFPHHGRHLDAAWDLLLATAPAEVWIPGRRPDAAPSTLALLSWLGIPARWPPARWP